MTTVAATSMISKKSTTLVSLSGGQERSDRGFDPLSAVPRHVGAPLVGLGDLDVDLVDACTGRRDAGVAVACGRQGAQRPGAGCGEEPEVAGGRRDDLGGELVTGVQQAHERTAHGLASAVDDAAGDHRLLLEVNAGR